MTNKQQNEYFPDKVSPPGETLSEMLEARGMARAELAVRLGCSLRAVEAIIRGEALITADTALGLERVLGAPAHFWLMRDALYRAWRAGREPRG